LRTTAEVSPYAMQHLDLWVPRRLREAAWLAAYETYRLRAPGGEGTKFWCAEKADRFWPIYIPEKPPID